MEIIIPSKLFSKENKILIFMRVDGSKQMIELILYSFTFLRFQKSAKLLYGQRTVADFVFRLIA